MGSVCHCGLSVGVGRGNTTLNYHKYIRMALFKTAASRLFASPQSTSPLAALASRVQQYSSESTDLREVLTNKIPEVQNEVKAFRKEHGNTKVGEITVDMMYGGMRGMKGLVTETSVLDPDEGIRFRGFSIPECQKVLPKAPGGEEPLPEGLFWLLLTGDIPTQAQVDAVSKEWADNADLPTHVVNMLNNFPSHLHPMAQFSAAITALNSESKFAAAYAEGVHKSKYWELCYEDPQFTELMRLYLTIHSDHEGGNVSAHTTHLV